MRLRWHPVAAPIPTRLRRVDRVCVDAHALARTPLERSGKARAVRLLLTPPSVAAAGNADDDWTVFSGSFFSSQQPEGPRFGSVDAHVQQVYTLFPGSIPG